MKKIWLIVNPSSGTKGKDHIVDLAVAQLKEAGHDVEVHTTEYAGHATELSVEAAENRVDIAVAIGGDGTVNEVASGLTGRDTALAIIPCGSGNGLARHLHIPLNVEGAIRTILRYEPLEIDYCQINDRKFFCTFGVGYDAEVAEEFSHNSNRGLLSYLKSALKVSRKFKPAIYTIDIPHFGRKTRSAYILSVCNASQYGNNAFIAPHASLSDGMLDIVIIAPIGLLPKLWLTLRLFTRTLFGSKYVKHFLAPSLTLRNEELKAFNAHLDGEPVTLSGDLNISCHKGGLHVIAPGNS